MISPDNPMAEYIFAASRMEDFLMVSAQRMTLLPSRERASLLADCVTVLQKMRRLNDEHFEASLYISSAINEVQMALEQIAHLNDGEIVEDKSDGEGDCVVCGTPITKFETTLKSPRYIIFCRRCYEPFTEANAKLRSSEGFGTCYI
jgi:hypothetical protein